VRWDVGYARQELLSQGAEEKLATPEWVANHYKWIVWKLASYERVFPTACAGSALTREAVIQQLQHRYNREHVLGHTPAVRALLQQDITPRAALALLVSAVHLPHSSPPHAHVNILAGNQLMLAAQHGLCQQQQQQHQGQHQQQQQQQQLGQRGMQQAGVGGGGAGSEAAVLELTDGWYSITAHLDEPLTQLALSGRLKVGTKLRFSCAQTKALHGPVSPLDPSALKSTSLRLAYNAVSPLPWDAKLGYQRHPLSFRPLGLIHARGGPVPCTMVVVQAKYAMHYWEKVNGQSWFRTERHQRERERTLAAHSEKAEDVAEREVRAAEECFCRQLLGTSPPKQQQQQQQQQPCKPTPAQRLYSSLVLKDGMLLLGGGSTGAGSDLGAGLPDGALDHIACMPTTWSDRDAQELRKLMAERRVLITEQHAAVHARTLASLRAPHVPAYTEHAGAGQGAGVVDMHASSCGVPARRLLLSAAVHSNAPPGAESIEALILLWRPKEDGEEDCSLVEGGVYLVTHLEPVEKPSNKLGLMELRAGKHTTWKQLGVAWEMCAGGTSASSSSCPTGMRVSWPNERLRLKLADLPQLHRMLAQQAQHVQQGVVPVGQCMFDYLGLVVGVGPVRLSGGLHGRPPCVTQWVYLADDSAHHMLESQTHLLDGWQEQQHEGEEMQQQQQQQQRQQQESWLLAVKIEGNAEAVDLLDEVQDAGQLLLFRHLQLESLDPQARMWLACAPDLASHVRVSCRPPHRDKGALEVAGWMSTCRAEVEAVQAHAAAQVRLR